jgi:hypothetical protein
MALRATTLTSLAPVRRTTRQAFTSVDAAEQRDEILMPRVGLQFAPRRQGAKQVIRWSRRRARPRSWTFASCSSLRIAALAARCATTAQLGYVRQCFSACGDAATHAAFETADAAFHRAIAAATHNEFLLRIFDVINALRNEPLWRGLKRRSFTSERRRTTNGIIAPSVKRSNSATASQRGYLCANLSGVCATIDWAPKTQRLGAHRISSGHACGRRIVSRAQVGNLDAGEWFVLTNRK